MNEHRENDRFSEQNVQMNENYNGGFVSEFLLYLTGLSLALPNTDSEFMDSFDNVNLQDPNYALNRSDESINQDVESLLASLNAEGSENFSKPEEIPEYDETSLTLAAYLNKFFLTKDDVKVLYEKIMDMTDAFPDSEWRPKFIYSNLEAGYWILKCADELSKQWAIETISLMPIQVFDVTTNLIPVPIKNLPMYKSEVVIKGSIISNDKILSRFAKQNKDIELSTSRWTELKCTPTKFNEYKLSLDLDLLSAERIKNNGFKLCFGMETVKFEIRDKLETAAIDIISTEQGGMSYY